MNMSLLLQSRKSTIFSLDYLLQGDGIGGLKRLFFKNIWNFQIFSLYLQSIKENRYGNYRIKSDSDAPVEDVRIQRK